MKQQLTLEINILTQSLTKSLFQVHSIRLVRSMFKFEEISHILYIYVHAQGHNTRQTEEATVKRIPATKFLIKSLTSFIS